MKTLYLLVGVTVAIMIAAVVLLALPGKESPAPAPTLSYASIPGTIEVASPATGATVTSPLIVTGRAVGPWYFEASFPIELRAQDGSVIAQGYAQAQGEWMTEEFVPFESIALTFAPQPVGSTGMLILRKDNPSGEPQFDQSLSVPVQF